MKIVINRTAILMKTISVLLEQLKVAVQFRCWKIEISIRNLQNDEKSLNKNRHGELLLCVNKYG